MRTNILEGHKYARLQHAKLIQDLQQQRKAICYLDE
jgi:hypothetical protein